MLDIRFEIEAEGVYATTNDGETTTKLAVQQGTEAYSEIVLALGVILAKMTGHWS